MRQCIPPLSASRPNWIRCLYKGLYHGLLLLSVLFTATQATAAETNRILYVGDSDFPPYEFLNKQGQPAGFNIDLIKAIADETGLEVTFKMAPWHQVLADIKSGTADVAALISSKQRDTFLDFTLPFAHLNYMLLARHSRKTRSISTPDTLEGLTVMVQRDSRTHEYLQHLQSRFAIDIAPVDSDPAALRLLASGQHDLALVAEEVGRNYIQQHAKHSLVSLNPAFLSATYHFAVAEGRDALKQRLNKGLQHLLASGYEEELHARWFNRQNGLTPVNILPYAAGLLLPLLALALFLSGWSWRLRRKAEENAAALHYHSNHDPLTRLPNRARLQASLSQALAEAKPNQLLIAVLHLDINSFREINDSLGHSTGDSLLQQVAARLQQHIPQQGSHDIVGCLGGDEFLIILTGLERTEQALDIARQLQAALHPPFTIAERDLFVEASIGISLAPWDGMDQETLFKHADTALHQAKAQGRGGIQRYAPEFSTEHQERLTITLDLRRALTNDELELHYQPQVSLSNGHIIGVEALLRWRHPEHGLVSPGRFIPVAEETGLILPIGDWVIQQACQQAASWRQAGLPSLRISVNLSVRQLQQASLAQTVQAALTESGLPAHCLELELTESQLMEQGAGARTMLDALQKLGVEFAIDDFGTGYSNLAYLKHLPFSRLKVDRAFVHDLAENAHDAAIVQAIADLSHGLQMTVIAEGVETQAQLEAVHRLGCDEVQGFYFSKPLPAQEMTQLLQQRNVFAADVSRPANVAALTQCNT